MNIAQTIGHIDALLPQTQCGRCGFDGCRPYAEAISAGQAYINRCSPGGETTIQALALLLGLEPRPLDPECGDPIPRRLARVEEQWCLGCGRCLAVCPVDAILGAPGQMHTVIAEECTGCEQCIVHCPVDCIQMRRCESPALSAGPQAVETATGAAHDTQGWWPGGWTRWQADRARRRHQARQLRLAAKWRKRAADYERKKKLVALPRQRGESRCDTIEVMLARVRTRRSQR
jgi:electron transport complex protein RnfB